MLFEPAKLNSFLRWFRGEGDSPKERLRQRLSGEGRSVKISDKCLVDGDNLKLERSNCHLRFHNELDNLQSESDIHFRFPLA